MSRLHAYRYPALALAVLLLLVTGAATIWGIGNFSASAARVEHTYRVINAIESTVAGVRAAESSARAYRLTGRAEQQAEYLAALPRVHQQIAELVALTVDNPDQQRRAQALQALAQRRLNESARLIALQDRVGAEQARDAALAGTGIALMQDISLLAEQMRAAEQALLDRRRDITRRRANLLIGLIALGIALPLVLLGLLLSGLLAENRRSRALEREARQAIRELEASSAQRDRLTEQHRGLSTYAGLLQSCQNLDEAMAMTANVMTELLPYAGGRCYVLRASQNLAESAAEFGHPAIASDPLLQPSQCWALRRGQPHRTDDVRGHVRCLHLEPDTSLAGIWTLCVPLMAQGVSLGLLHVSAREGDGRAEQDSAVVEAIAEQLGLAMVNLQLRETLRVQSLRDPLTGLFNRRYLEENLNRELQRCERRGLPLSVLMLDVDHFKRFNDQHGHAAGDALLARVGQTLQSMTRDEDIACRYGGEEFTVVLPEADGGIARQRAEEIRAAIGGTTITHMRKILGPATASIGVATFPGDGDAQEKLLEVADASLYRAKAEGRDRVV